MKIALSAAVAALMLAIATPAMAGGFMDECRSKPQLTGIPSDVAGASVPHDISFKGIDGTPLSTGSAYFRGVHAAQILSISTRAPVGDPDGHPVPDESSAVWRIYGYDCVSQSVDGKRVDYFVVWSAVRAIGGGFALEKAPAAITAVYGGDIAQAYDIVNHKWSGEGRYRSN